MPLPRSKEMERWLQGFLRTHSLDAALGHAREQRALDPDGKQFWDYVVNYIGFLKATEMKMEKTKPSRRTKRTLSVPEQHQLKIARDSLKMPDAMLGVMGGPSKVEAREIVKRLTGKTPKENPGTKGERITARDVNVLKNANGYWVLSTIKDGHRVQNVYGDYTKREAMREFLAAVNGPQKNPAGRAKAMTPWYVEGGKPGKMGGRTSQSLYSYELAEELAKRWSKELGLATIRRADNEDTIVGQAVDGKITAGPRLKNPRGVSPTPKEAREILAMLRAKRKAVLIKRGAVGKTRLRRAGKKRTMKGRRSNPVIGILGNPPVDAKYLGKVTYIEYTHGHDGKKYFHDFTPAVFAQVMDDGSVRLWHPTNNLWKLFPVSN